MINVINSVRVISYGMVKDIQRYLNEFKDKTLHNNATFSYFEYRIYLYEFLESIPEDESLITVHTELHYYFERLDTGRDINRPLNNEELKQLAYELGLEMKKNDSSLSYLETKDQKTEYNIKNEDYNLNLSSKDIMGILKLSRRKTYEFLSDNPPFPVKRVGRDYKINRDKFFEWYMSN